MMMAGVWGRLGVPMMMTTRVLVVAALGMTAVPSEGVVAAEVASAGVTC